MAERPPHRPKSLFARPRALLVDDRPHRIEMPAPPPIQMAVPEPSPAVAPTRGRALQLPAAPAPLPDDPAPEPPDDAAVPQSGPARLYIGPPRAVAPVMVRAGLDERTDISEGPELRPGGDGTEFRFALPRGDRVPARAKGLERGASTVVATPERRVWTETEPQAEAPPSREVIRLDNTARPRPGPLEPPLRRPVTSEVIGAPSPPGPKPPAPAPPVPEERDLPHDHPPVEAPGVNLADDGFFERQGVPSARLPDRALQPPLPPVRTANRKFVPRTPPPRRSVPAWAWALTGVVLLVAGLAGTWSRIRGDIDHAERPAEPSLAADALPEEGTSDPDTPRVPGGEEEPRVEAPPVEPPPVEPPPVEAPPVDPTPVATPPVEAVPVVPPPAEPAPTRADVESPLRLVGVLRVVSNAPGKIYIDGKYKAAIDEEVVLELAAGVHDVKLVPRGGRAQTQKVRVDAGEARGVVFQVK